MRQDVIACPAQAHPVTTLTHEFSADHEIPPHTHPEHQLIYACRGVMTVWTGPGTWVVPPQRAVWIPAKTPHGIAMYGPVSMRTLYVKPRLVHLSRDCRVVNVSPLLRELIIYACRFPALRRRVKAQAHLIEMIIDQLEIVETLPIHLINPTDPRAARIAAALAAEPTEPPPLGDICKL